MCVTDQCFDCGLTGHETAYSCRQLAPFQRNLLPDALKTEAATFL